MEVLQKLNYKNYINLPLFYKLLCFLLVIAIFYSIGTDIFSDIDLPITDVHIDAFSWYHSTYHYHLFFCKKSLFHNDWTRGVSSFDQPNIGKYFFGFFLSLHGIDVNKSFTKWEKWWQAGHCNTDAEFLVYLKSKMNFSDDALLIGRFYSGIFSYLALLVCYMYMIRITNCLFATATIFYLAKFPLFYVQGMMTDHFLLFFYLLALLLYDCIYKANTFNKRILSVIIYSLISGITMGIKLSGFLVLLFFPSYIIVKIFTKEKREEKYHNILLLLLHISVALFTFTILHPQVYENPFIGIYHFIVTRLNITSIMAGNILMRIVGEFYFQINLLVENMQTLLHLDNKYLFIIVVAMLNIGLLSMTNIIRREGKTIILRFMPMLITVIAFPICLSSQWDGRYMWVMTIIMSLVMMYGFDYVFKKATRIVKKIQLSKHIT